MLLYHFTAKVRLASIMETGLSLGDVPVNGPTGAGLKAVWLTADADPTAHGLGEAREMTEAERIHTFRWKGVMPEPGTRWLNKREVRIQVRLPSSDSNLHRWLPWARKRLDAWWLEGLTKAGGGKSKAESWWLYFGTIPASLFREVRDLETGAMLVEKGLKGK